MSSCACSRHALRGDTGRPQTSVLTSFTSGPQSSCPHSGTPVRVQVFTGGAQCQVVDSEEEPEDGEEEVGRPFHMGTCVWQCSLGQLTCLPQAV